MKYFMSAFFMKIKVITDKMIPEFYSVQTVPLGKHFP